MDRLTAQLTLLSRLDEYEDERLPASRVQTHGKTQESFDPETWTSSIQRNAQGSSEAGTY